MSSNSTQVWGTYCSETPREHSVFAASYTHCPLCRMSNPNAANLPRTIREQSVLINRQAPAPAPAGQTAPGHTSFTDRARVAEGHRQAGFKRNQPQGSNAGSRAAPFRSQSVTGQPSKAELAAAKVSTQAFRLKVEIHIQTLKIAPKKNTKQPLVWTHGDLADEPYFQWVCSIKESDLQGSTTLLSWLVRRCPLKDVGDFEWRDPQYIEHVFVDSWSEGSNQAIPIVEPEERSIEQLLTPFEKLKPGYCIKILFLFAKDAATKKRHRESQYGYQSSPAPLLDEAVVGLVPPIRPSRSSSRARSVQRSEAVGIIDTTELVDNQAAAEAYIKLEWTDRLIDTTKIPEVVDLSASPAGKNRSHSSAATNHDFLRNSATKGGSRHYSELHSSRQPPSPSPSGSWQFIKHTTSSGSSRGNHVVPTALERRNHDDEELPLDPIAPQRRRDHRSQSIERTASQSDRSSSLSTMASSQRKRSSSALRDQRGDASEAVEKVGMEGEQVEEPQKKQKQKAVVQTAPPLRMQLRHKH